MAINNNIVFNSALAGCSGGVQNGRWLTNSDPASYTTIQAQIVAFATAVDAAITTDPTINDADGEVIEAICFAMASEKFLQNQSPSNLAIVALAVSAYWTKMRAALQPVSGATINPLSNVRYVGINTTNTSPNGSQSNPFATIQDAIDSIVGEGTIYLVPGSYGEETINCSGRFLSIIGMAVGVGSNNVPAVTIHNVISDTDLYIADIDVDGNITNTASLVLINANVSGFVDVTGGFTASSSDPGGLNIVVGAVNCSFCSLFQYGIGNLTATGSVIGVNSGFQNITIPAATQTSFTNCTFLAGSTLTGGNASTSIFIFDYLTNESFLNNAGVSIVTAHLKVVGALPSDTVAFIVAGIAANQNLLYVNATIPSTSPLFGLATDDPITVNPTGDLAAAGLLSGYVVNCRVSAANTIRVAFKGQLPDATYNLIITRLSKS